MKVVIDRFEGKYAIVETNNKEFYHLEKQLLESASEGDIIEIKVLTKETKERKKKIDELVNTLFE